MKVILSRYPIFLIKETAELDDNYERKHLATNVDSGESFGPAPMKEVREWCHSYDIIETLGIFDNDEAADEAGDNYDLELRAKYMPDGYNLVVCCKNHGVVDTILDSKERKMPTPEEVAAKLKELLGGDVNIRTVEDEDECEIHNFMKKDDDDEPTLN